MAHWEWMIRKRRAQLANAVGRPFTYRHRLLGRFVYHPSDDLSRQVLLYDFEQLELQFAIQQAQRGGTIVDVGANIGVFTVACARATLGKGHVIALEPSPATFEKLKFTCVSLGLTNVELLRIAAAREDARRSFVAGGIHDLRHHLADARQEPDGQSIDVETCRLDDVCGERAESVTLLKVDVEGHEVEVLEGAARILQGRRVSLIVEFYPRGLAAAATTPTDLWALLQRTHECIAVVCPDASTRPPVESSVTGDDNTFNTLWMPRASSGGPDRG